MITRIKNGKIIADKCIEENKFVYFNSGRIQAITEDILPYDHEIDAGGNYVSPGFIDLHTHGGGNCDFMDSTVDAFFTICKTHAEHGTTTLLPTTLSGDMEELKRVFDIYNQAICMDYQGANMPGLHLEGPYFALSQKGAQNEKYIKNPNIKEYSSVLKCGAKILRWSAAPELEGALEFGKFLRKNDILPSIGHTEADFGTVKKAFLAGYTHITHLYSCMTSVHRKNAFRYAGVVEAAYLIDGMTVEIIADGIHLPPPLMEMVYRFIGPDRTALITDSMRAAGAGDGESILGSLTWGQKVIVEDGVAKLPDRSAFAGSVATMDRAVRTMLKNTSATICDTIKMAASTPAKIAGLKTKGILAPGMDADIVIFDDDININMTIINGRVVYKK